MATQNYIELNLNDERAGKVAEVLSNKTAKKILGLLAEEELSQGDIAKKLGVGLNNVDYNIKKLLESGLIEKSSGFFWSVKGKKIPTYKLANKKIVISTKNSFKPFAFSAVIGAVIFAALKFGFNYKINISRAAGIPQSDSAVESMPAFAEASKNAVYSTSSIWSNVLVFALAGVAVGLLGFWLYKKLKGGFN